MIENHKAKVFSDSLDEIKDYGVALVKSDGEIVDYISVTEVEEKNGIRFISLSKWKTPDCILDIKGIRLFHHPDGEPRGDYNFKYPYNFLPGDGISGITLVVEPVSE